MKYVLKEMTEMEKPREKLLYLGTNALTDYELLAILLRTGTKYKSVIDLSKEIIEEYNGLNNLQNVVIEELIKIKGIGRIKAIELLAAIELGKRITNYKKIKTVIKNSYDAYLYSKNNMAHLTQEYFSAIYLAINNEVICERVINVGTINQTVASPKDVISWGLKFGAYAVIVLHNHPSGDPTPSKADYSFTLKVNEACNAVDFKFVDHIIIGKNNYYSFKEKRIIYE